LSLSRAERGWLLLYEAVVYPAAALVSALMLWRGLRDRSQRERFSERFGLGAALPEPVIWVHTVSVGEVQAAVPLVRALRQRFPAVPLLVTTFTSTGNARARALFQGIAQVRYLPFDLCGSVRRFLERVQPRLAVMFETELWPNLYHACARRRIPLLVASARLSPRSTGRYLRARGLFRPMLAQGVVVAAQEQEDAERFRRLGADPGRTFVTGNVKFDLTVPRETRERGERLRRQYAPDRPAWVAGSTHAGEEEAVLAAARAVLRSEPRTLLVLAPRHPPRFADVAGRIGQAGFTFVRRSRPQAADIDAQAQVLLLDTLGELVDFYASADVAFVGGSLVPIGGHNLLEPAAVGVPILTGPSSSNAPEIARLLVARGAAEVVRDAHELGARVAALLGDRDARSRIGEQAVACIEANRGSVQKIIDLAGELFEPEAVTRG
jgi:3-deoxy-D-manno-octulosonic-acid transferase